MKLIKAISKNSIFKVEKRKDGYYINNLLVENEATLGVSSQIAIDFHRKIAKKRAIQSTILSIA